MISSKPSQFTSPVQTDQPKDAFAIGLEMFRVWRSMSVDP